MSFACAIIALTSYSISLIYLLNTPFSDWLHIELNQFLNALARMKSMG